VELDDEVLWKTRFLVQVVNVLSNHGQKLSGVVPGQQSRDARRSAASRIDGRDSSL
jgi:hypothetical protein